MTVFGALGFTTPWLLLGMLALPVLWIVLRAVPPAPVRRMFPGVALLLGLTDDSQETDRTPWWLLMLRSLAVAAVIAALAGPVLNPRTDGAGASDLPLLVVMDATWASAPDWARRVDAAEARMAEAGRRGRPVALILTTAPEPAAFQPASAWIARLPGLTPAPWQAGPDQLAELILGLPQGAFDTYWVTDGLARDTRRDLLNALDARGTVTVVATERPILGLAPVRLEDGALVLTLKRATPGPARQVTVAVHGTDPAGNAVVLDRADASFDPESNMAEARLTLPAELRARITRIRRGVG
ncbi:MAG: BatA domain-containing protein [Paracoccaceae bacterium]